MADTPIETVVTVTNADDEMSEEELVANTVVDYNILTKDDLDGNFLRPEKRKDRGSEEEDEDKEWIQVKSKEKRHKVYIDKTEVYISYKEPLPRAFALAKMLKECNISEIERVKYINPYKVRLDIKSEPSAERLLQCQELIDKGWHIQKAMVKNLSYGVIRDVDVDMSEEEILKSITCVKPAQLVSVFRLNKRSTSNTGWTKSESVRLCFKGDMLPAYVAVDDLKIKVDPYVFPVSQCSRCWQLGHGTKRCGSNKIVCPKCADNHENCDTTLFKCVNCGGNHMAMYKGCPAFIKEKKLRDIMAEFNVTYRRAISMYSAPSPPRQNETPQKIFKFNASGTPLSTVHFPPLQRREATPGPEPSSHQNIMSFSNAVQKPARPKLKQYNQTGKVPKKQNHTQEAELDQIQEPYENASSSSRNTEQKIKEITFAELLQRLKEIIFMNETSFQLKVKNTLKCCVEWLILVVVDNLSDWPFLKKLLDFFISDG